MLCGRSASADFKAGLDAYKRNDYQTAFREWRPLAEQGNALAQLYVARMYEDGRGTRRSFGEARRWYDRAAASFPPGADRDRAIRGRDRMDSELKKKRVEPDLVGTWRLVVPPAEWLLEISDAGEFWFTIKRGEASRVETGVFRAKDGKWEWTTLGEKQGGTYRVIDSNSVEITGHLGTGRWTRVGAVAQEPGGGTAGPPGAGRVIFEDDFRSKRQSLEWPGPDCKSSYGDGGFIIENVRQWGTCSLPLRAAAEFRASVRIELSARLRRGPQNHGYGLMFGHSGDGPPLYTLLVAADGRQGVFLLQKNQDWKPLLDWKPDPVVKRGYGATNRLAVEVQGRTIRASVNGTQVGSVQAPAEVGGYVGMFVDAPGMEVVFSDLRVTELSPKGHAVVPVAPSGVRRAEDTLYGVKDEIKGVRIGWHFDAWTAYEAGLIKNLPIVMVFHADWCKWCWKLIDEALTCPSVNRFAGYAVFAHVKEERDEAAATIRKTLKIEGTVAITVLKPNPEKLYEMGRANGFHKGDKVAQMLTESLPPKYPIPKGSSLAQIVTPLSKTPVNHAACSAEEKK
jgi:hypothetical protein